MGEYLVFIGKIYAIRSKGYFDLIATLLIGIGCFFLLKHKTDLKPDFVDDLLSVIVQIQAALLGFSISLYAIFTTIFNGQSSPGNIPTKFKYNEQPIYLFEWFSLVFLKILAIESLFVLVNIVLMIIEFNTEILFIKPAISILTLVYLLLINFKVMLQKYILTNSKKSKDAHK